MVTLKNQHLTVKINEIGAQLESVVYNNTEYMWQPDPAIWNDSAPILFPICGGLKEDTYTYEGKSYTLGKHGFVRKALFAVESADENRAVLLFTSSAETLAVYPFAFELRVIFTLDGMRLATVYEVRNRGDKTMYFSVGAHEGYATPEGIESYDVIFAEEETLNTSRLYGNIVAKETAPMLKESRVFPLYESYFAIDALVFRSIRSDSVTLRNRKNGRAFRLDFPFASSFLIWHKHYAPYICLEPWAGIPDIEGSGYDITQKEGILSLGAGETYQGEHSMTILA